MDLRLLACFRRAQFKAQAALGSERVMSNPRQLKGNTQNELAVVDSIALPEPSWFLQ
jgi:hypothetical protein